jgi:hypothetical protein
VIRRLLINLLLRVADARRCIACTGSPVHHVAEIRSPRFDAKDSQRHEPTQRRRLRVVIKRRIFMIAVVIDVAAATSTLRACCADVGASSSAIGSIAMLSKLSQALRIAA